MTDIKNSGTAKIIKIPGPHHPISIERNPGRILVSVEGRVVADSLNAIDLHEATYLVVHYIPITAVDMSLLTLSTHATFCPYKGDCSYYSINAEFAGDAGRNVVWSYQQPFLAVAAIKDHVAFYADRVVITASAA